MRRYFLLAALAASIWGSTGPIVRILEMDGNGYLFGSLKITLGLLGLSVPLLWQRRPFWTKLGQAWRQNWLMLLGSSACLALGMTCIFQAFALSASPTLVSAVFYTQPLLSSLGAQLLQGRLSGRLLLAAFICFGGVLVVLVAINGSLDLAQNGQTAGLLWALSAAALITAWTIAQQYFPRAELSDYSLALCQTAVSAVIIVSIMAFGGHWDGQRVARIFATPHQAGWLLFNGVLSYCSTILFLRSLRHGGTALVAPAAFADVITTPFWAWLIIGTAIVPWSLVGIAITVAGGYLALRPDPATPTVPTASTTATPTPAPASHPAPTPAPANQTTPPTN